MSTFRADEGRLVATLTFDEACGQVNGLKPQCLMLPAASRTAGTSAAVIFPGVLSLSIFEKKPTVPYTMQIIIQSAQPPADCDVNGSYVHTSGSTCTSTATKCHGNQLRAALQASLDVILSQRVSQLCRVMRTWMPVTFDVLRLEVCPLISV